MYNTVLYCIVLYLGGGGVLYFVLGKKSDTTVTRGECDERFTPIATHTGTHSMIALTDETTTETCTTITSSRLSAIYDECRGKVAGGAPSGSTSA